MIAGRYTLSREIGRGGMGAVWLGRDELLGRDVALKRLGGSPGAGNPDFERAEREAKLAARLNHPHVVAVFDLVDDGDEQWLVMEHVEGLNLSALVKRDGPLSVDQAAIVIRQAAEALAEAHAAGIVHRDVKPSNILVTPTGQVKLTDFGIARAEADASLTQTGLVTGSPAYLAPEVATGRTATDASDVWSLGATLFHALEGGPPYDTDDNVLGTMYKIVNEDPPRPTERRLARARDAGDDGEGPERPVVDAPRPAVPLPRPGAPSDDGGSRGRTPDPGDLGAGARRGTHATPVTPVTSVRARRVPARRSASSAPLGAGAGPGRALRRRPRCPPHGARAGQPRRRRRPGRHGLVEQHVRVVGVVGPGAEHLGGPERVEQRRCGPRRGDDRVRLGVPQHGRLRPGRGLGAADPGLPEGQRWFRAVQEVLGSVRRGRHQGHRRGSRRPAS